VSLHNYEVVNNSAFAVSKWVSEGSGKNGDIKQWSENQDDRPTNGLSLCRLCHWSFDEGLMSVGVEYEVLVSGRVGTEQTLPGHILTLRDRPIFTPDETQYWPARDNLADHRKGKFLL